MWRWIWLGGFVVFLVGWLSGRHHERKRLRIEETAPGEARFRVEGRVREAMTPPKRCSTNSTKPDAWEGAFWDATEPRGVSVTLEIEYRDASGQGTKRVVRTRAFDERLEGGLLIGHCELRNASRTFRFDRVLSAVDVDTGEEIDDLRVFLNRRYAESPERARDEMASRFRELLRVLLYVAKADGSYRRDEKVVIRDFCRQLAHDSRMSDNMIDSLFARLEVPTLASFRAAVRNILEQQLCSPQKLKQVCEQIVDTQGTRTTGEVEALEYLSQRVARTESARQAAQATQK